MRLPKMKYAENAAQKQMVAFRGLNLSDNTQDGDIAAAENLSVRRFPLLSPRMQREPISDYTAPTAIFAWGKLIVVDGTSLIYDGETVGTVTTGEKQFAVVNTKLCIWPDKMYLDLNSKEFKPLNASLSSVADSQATFTANSLTMSPNVYATKTQRLTYAYGLNSYNVETPYIKTYTAASWSAENGWTLTGEAEVSPTNEAAAASIIGKIVMLKKSAISGDWQLNWKNVHVYNSGGQSHNDVTDYTENNTDGYYGIVTSCPVSSYNGVAMYLFGDVNFNVVSAIHPVPDFRSYFKAGDRVTVSGSADAGRRADRAKVTAVSANSLTFPDGTFSSAGTDTAAITIERTLPALDYICESENRLWGVCNADKTIYASSLGDPGNFFAYDGVSTDSYAVAVGSHGDFTGICALGGNVLCWKEECLHKILGSYPAEYQMATYQYAGVLRGCSKSMVNINEVLFYLGTGGVYAYSGGAPNLISSAFGNHRYSAGTAGTDGTKYFLSAKEGDKLSLLVYDTATGFWMREDDADAVDFARLDGNLYLLSSDGSVWAESAGVGSEIVTWSAQLAPFFETIQGRKRYSRVFVRAEVPKGSRLTVEYRCDGGKWESAGTSTGQKEDTEIFPVVPRRCDKFEIRISGKGPCAVLELLREYRVGSEV